MSKQVVTGTYEVWITAMSSAYAGDLVWNLIKRGLSVTMMGSGTHSKDGSPACVISVKVTGTPKPSKTYEGDVSASHMLHVIQDALKKIDSLYYSVVVNGPDQSTAWDLGNIDIREIKKEIAEKENIASAIAIEKEIELAISPNPGFEKRA